MAPPAARPRPSVPSYRRTVERLVPQLEALLLKVEDEEELANPVRRHLRQARNAQHLGNCHECKAIRLAYQGFKLAAEDRIQLAYHKSVLQYGDFYGEAYKRVKDAESRALNDWAQHERKRLTIAHKQPFPTTASSEGLPELAPDTLEARKLAREAIAEANPWLSWELFTKRRADVVAELVTEEVKKVRRWQEGGSLPANAPATPVLDRVSLTCLEADYTFQEFLEVCESYSEPNELAHHPPPKFIDFIDVVGTMDWAGYSAALTAMESTPGMDSKAQRIASRIRKDLFKADGSPTAYAVRSFGRFLRDWQEAVSLAAEVKPPSPYYPGKWAYILPV